jgi:predicted P-loop ATPase
MGRDQVHANSVAPLLISSEQGMMKSTFCKSLMPEALQAYYTDQADLSAKGNIENKLALMGLINLDEFDRLSPQRMAQLKNLMQMPSLNIRKAYQKNFRSLPRIASFIGTSNRKDLLTDPTGSRRFLCVEVEQKIDCANIDLNQIYAQLKAELLAGKPYWFSSEEEEEIQQHNASFYQVCPEEELFRARFRAPQTSESYEELSLVDILDELRESHAHLLRHVDYKQFGAALVSAGIERVHTRFGNRYKVTRVA